MDISGIDPVVVNTDYRACEKDYVSSFYLLSHLQLLILKGDHMKKSEKSLFLQHISVHKASILKLVASLIEFKFKEEVKKHLLCLQKRTVM